MTDDEMEEGDGEGREKAYERRKKENGGGGTERGRTVRAVLKEKETGVEREERGRREAGKSRDWVGRGGEEGGKREVEESGERWP
ncbi:hypothetical protein Pmani_029634 [Petrolisthes manimaculis]|uniref:Uncharacterized protein n=1 Tax=Petrolisthes manimaculis TaxID=1843537 RepID=A0AAE1NXL3_9EUCA|nr:hypothetical protein Pmani_029634 [Petrolisthes manimaculis]